MLNTKDDIYDQHRLIFWKSISIYYISSLFFANSSKIDLYIYRFIPYIKYIIFESAKMLVLLPARFSILLWSADKEELGSGWYPMGLSKKLSGIRP